jgi:hypothetical protein
MTESLESQIPVALAALGVAFYTALVEAQPSLAEPLKGAVLASARSMEDRGAGWELAADSMKVLSRALNDPTLRNLRP